jgi:hypothetical protein
MKSPVKNNFFISYHFLKNILSLSPSYVQDQKFFIARNKIAIITVLYTLKYVFVFGKGGRCPTPQLLILTWFEMLNIISRERHLILATRLLSW